MGWKTKAKVLLDKIQATMNQLKVDLVDSTEFERSLEDFGSDDLRNQVKELYTYLEVDAYKDVDTEEIEDEEEEEEEYEE